MLARQVVIQKCLEVVAEIGFPVYTSDELKRMLVESIYRAASSHGTTAAAAGMDITPQGYRKVGFRPNFGRRAILQADDLHYIRFLLLLLEEGGTDGVSVADLHRAYLAEQSRRIEAANEKRRAAGKGDKKSPVKDAFDTLRLLLTEECFVRDDGERLFSPPAALDVLAPLATDAVYEVARAGDEGMSIADLDTLFRQMSRRYSREVAFADFLDALGEVGGVERTADRIRVPPGKNADGIGAGVANRRITMRSLLHALDTWLHIEERGEPTRSAFQIECATAGDREALKALHFELARHALAFLNANEAPEGEGRCRMTLTLTCSSDVV
jgi:hypothetical protein